MSVSNSANRFRQKIVRLLIIAPPYVWMIVFFLLPFLFVLKISFSEAVVASPPFAPLVDYNSENGTLNATLRLFNYHYLISDGLYLKAYLTSLKIASISTVLCLLVGYPMALAIARSPKVKQPILLIAIMLPFWTSLLIRVYAWVGILRQDGILNSLLLWTGIINEPLVMLQSQFAAYLVVTYAYLPFMILPLYAVLEKQDLTLLDAARDLGANPITTFGTVTLPLSLPSVLAGCMLVFIPVVGEFVIPTMLGGQSTLMIGKVLWTEFFSNRDWPVASAVAVVMLLLLIIPIMIFQNHQAKQEL
jgi:putrescine transport system permease protein